MKPFDHKRSLSHFHVFIQQQPLLLAEFTEAMDFYLVFHGTLAAFRLVSDTKQKAGHKARRFVSVHALRRAQEKQASTATLLFHLGVLGSKVA